jgi:hypothetical protein
VDAEKSMAYLKGWRDGYAAALRDLAERGGGFDPIAVEQEREEIRNGP